YKNSINIKQDINKKITKDELTFNKKKQGKRLVSLNKGDVDELYIESLKNIEQFGLNDNHKYIVKSIFTAIIGSAFGINFILSNIHVDQKIDDLLGKCISLV